MIHIIRPPSPLPKTRTVIRAGGGIIVPWTLPTEREQRRRWRESYSRPPVICAEGCD